MIFFARTTRGRRISATQPVFLRPPSYGNKCADVANVVDTATERAELSLCRGPEWQPTSAAGIRSTREPQYQGLSSEE